MSDFIKKLKQLKVYESESGVCIVLHAEIEALIEEENNKPIGFGDIVEVEQHRYVSENEFYQYKVIGTLKSNFWIDVPVSGIGKETLHEENEDIVICVCSGIIEEKIERFRLKDVKKI